MEIIATGRIRLLSALCALALSCCPAALAAAPKTSQPLPSALPPALPGDRALSLFPESADLRARYWDGFIAAARDVALSRPPATLQGRDGLFRFSSGREAGAFYLVVAAIKGNPPPAAARVPVYTQGSWIYKRSLVDGSFEQVKIFLRSDPGTFIRVYPDGDRSRMDVLLYGAVLARNVPLPVPFERVGVAALSDIVEWSRYLVDWSLFSPKPGLYRGVASVAATIRARLPTLNYGDDGALDAKGAAVYIHDGLPQTGKPGLNCSGFAKWVIDGFYGPLTGHYLDPRAMAERRIGSRGGDASAHYEQLLDPFFGLDWTRNLALALSDVAMPERKHSITEADVTTAPFALIAATRAQPVNGASLYEPYAPPDASSGYAARGLKALLYLLAVRDPGCIYLASVSRSGGGEFAVLRRHYHVAVLIPYFDDNGEFRAAVFESDAETSVEALVSRAPDEMIHLVRVGVLPDFDPPPMPAAVGLPPSTPSP